MTTPLRESDRFTGLLPNRIMNRAPSPSCPRQGGSPSLTPTSSGVARKTISSPVQNSTPKTFQNPTPKTQLSLSIESSQSIEQALRKIQANNSCAQVRKRERVPKELSASVMLVLPQYCCSMTIMYLLGVVARSVSTAKRAERASSVGSNGERRMMKMMTLFLYLQKKSKEKGWRSEE